MQRYHEEQSARSKGACLSPLENKALNGTSGALVSLPGSLLVSQLLFPRLLAATLEASLSLLLLHLPLT